MWMSSVSQSSNQRSRDYVGHRAVWCHTFWQHDKKRERRQKNCKRNNLKGSSCYHDTSVKWTHTKDPSLNLATDNKALSETFMTFINKSQWLMLALFFGISNKVWHIYTLGHCSQNPIKHVGKDRWPWNTHNHTHRLVGKKEIYQTMAHSCFPLKS